MVQPTTGQLMFSQACACPQGEGWVCLVPGPFQQVCVSEQMVGVYQWVIVPEVMYNPLPPPSPPPHTTWDINPLLVLTPSGSHHSTYGWQAGSTHHTGMLSSSCCLSMGFKLSLFVNSCFEIWVGKNNLSDGNRCSLCVMFWYIKLSIVFTFTFRWWVRFDCM